jgi:hypothetical protein
MGAIRLKISSFLSVIFVKILLFLLKRWTKNSKRLDDYIKKYNQDMLPIPVEIEQSLRHIFLLIPVLVKNVLSCFLKYNKFILSDY